MRRMTALALAVPLALGLPAANGGAWDDLSPAGLAIRGPGSVEVRIVDDGFGVPHVYSATNEGVAYGAGFAVARDRLSQLEVLRAVARGETTELFGPVPGFPEMDAAARRLFSTDDERAAKFERLPDHVRRLVLAYVDGINERMQEVRADPRLLPHEYVTFGLGQPRAWRVVDTVAISDLLVQTFGAGGGTELSQAELLHHLLDEFGAEEGVAAFDDIRWLNDPASPVSIPRDFDWRREPTFADPLPPKQWRFDARIGLTDEQREPIGRHAVGEGPQIGTLEQAGLVPRQPSEQSEAALRAHTRGLEKLDEIVSFGSNAFVIGPERTAGGGTVQLGGPQVGQFSPQIIMEFGLHSEEGWDMTGMTFAGAGPAVLIGRTPFFAFTTTTGNSDASDIYVEQLGPDDPRTYVYQNQVFRMDCRTETIATKGGVPFAEEEICRTRNGPVLAIDETNGVAFSIRRSWFDFETGTVEGFFNSNFVDSLNGFATEMNKLQSNHNMFYTDADGNFGYWHPGGLPIRHPRTDVRLPQDGRFSATDWRRLRTAQEVPHAVNFERGWLANWNNKPAVDWDNGDGANYGGVFRSQLLNDQLRAEPGMDLERGNDLIRVNATTELEFRFFADHIVEAARASDDPQIQAAGEVLADWDARREDTTGDGTVDSEPGFSLWKGWRGIARSFAFSDDLGSFTGRSSDSMLLHALDGEDASLTTNRDWLGGEGIDDLLNRVMRENLDRLADEYGTSDMSQWEADMPTQHYTRLNARFYDCEVARAVATDVACNEALGGNVRALDFMNRGTYNHLVDFTPGEADPSLPEVGFSTDQRDGYAVTAGSIISPGQSGFIDLVGRQDDHYDDQHELYASWQYKPMPTREDDVLALGGGEVRVLAYDPDAS